jgi:hypothetical protein
MILPRKEEDTKIVYSEPKIEKDMTIKCQAKKDKRTNIIKHSKLL